MVPGCSRSQISCKAAGSWQAAKPLDSSVNAIPAWAACRLAPSCPLTQILAGQGKYAQTLMNAGPKSASRK